MGGISLVEELYSTDENLEIKDMNELVDIVVNEFSINRSELINDVEKGEIPTEALDKQIIQFIDDEKLTVPGEEREELLKKVHDYLYGYYIIQDEIEDPTITDIKLVAQNNISIKKVENGRAIRKYLDKQFSSEESFRVFCNYIAIRNEGSINGKNAIQVLTDKHRNKDFILRIDITGKIINSNGLPCVALRKIPKKKPTAEDLIKMGMFSEEMKEYFIEKINAGAIIVLCGQGGSGKTSWMNTFLEELDPQIHALVAQESEELHSKRKNIIFQKMKKKVAENDTEYLLGDLTKNAMIMDEDLIIIGEIKGKEAIFLYNATYSGHSAWTSIHACSSEEALNKFVHYMKLGNTDLKRSELLEMLSTIDMIIYMKDFKCMEVTEIKGFDKKIVFNPVFKFNLDNETFDRLNKSCERIQNKVFYKKYRDRR